MPHFVRPLRCEALEDRRTPAAAGGLDPTFGVGGRLALPTFDDATFSPSAVAVQADGHVVVVGPVTPSSPNVDFGIVRFNPDGLLDTAFGDAGRVRVAFDIATSSTGELPDVPTAVAVQPDGRVVVVGTAAVGNEPPHAAVARLLPDGRLDPTFDGDGKATFSLTTDANIRDTVRAVALQPDGRIVLAGSVTVGADVYHQMNMGVARLLADGSLDPTFGGGGRLAVAFPLGQYNGAEGQSLAVQADGRILVGGGAWSKSVYMANPGDPLGHGLVTPVRDAVVARLTPGGTLDPTFADGGRLDLPFRTPSYGYGASQLQSLADGSAVVVVPDAVFRLTPGGTVDPTYGTGGAANVSGVVGVGPGGEVVYNAGGSSTTGGDGRLGRLTAAGQVDPTYGTETLGDVYTGALPAVVAADGSVTFVGVTYNTPRGSPTAVIARATGGRTAFPVPVGSVLAGGTPDGAVQLLAATSGGFAAAVPTVLYGGFTGTVRTAVADVNGDGVPDLIGGAGPGGSPTVTVVDGATADRLDDFLAFEAGFTGGVFVAAADVDGDGKADVVVTPDQGGGPVVAVFGGAGLAAGRGADAQVNRFFGIDDPAFRGGARPAVGDLTGDGAADLVVSAGFLGGPRVAVYDGRSTGSGAAAPVKLLPDFFAFESTLRNGAFVAVGDVTGDGRADLAFGGGPGGGPRVRVFDGAAVLAAGSLDGTVGRVADFFAGDAAARGGVHVALRDEDGDGQADLLTGSGDGDPARVRVYRAAAVRGGGTPTAAEDFDPFGGSRTLASGVFVG